MVGDGWKAPNKHDRLHPADFLLTLLIDFTLPYHLTIAYYLYSRKLNIFPSLNAAEKVKCKVIG